MGRESLFAIWKWTLHPTDIQEIAMPEGTEIIAVAEQQGDLVMWGICNVSAPNQTRVFAVVGTGNPAPCLSDSRHIGTDRHVVRPRLARLRADRSNRMRTTPSVTDDVLFLEIRSRAGDLITQWSIPVGEDSSEVDVDAEIAYLRSPYPGDPHRSWADAILDGDS